MFGQADGTGIVSSQRVQAPWAGMPLEAGDRQDESLLRQNGWLAEQVAGKLMGDRIGGK